MEVNRNYVEKKLDIFKRNDQLFKKVKGYSYLNGISKSLSTLALTGKNIHVDINGIEECLAIIKENTGFFSNFRGEIKYYIATIIYGDISRNNGFQSILEIYNKLKNAKFKGNEYLTLTAAVIYQNKGEKSVDEILKNMENIYDFMRSKHPFLTSADDYAKAALIAIHSNEIHNDLNTIEEYYRYLNNKGFYKGNNLQSLSHILYFSKESVEETCHRVIQIQEKLKEKDIKLDGYGYPLIGALSLLNVDNERLTDDIIYVSNKLKDVKGFGNFIFGKKYRDMLSCNIVALSYEECLKESTNINTFTGNVFLEIVAAMNAAITIATVTAVSAATSSAST